MAMNKTEKAYKELALKAMRYDVEQMWLKDVAKIDKQLKELENKVNT